MSYCAPSDPHHLTKAQARNQWGVAAACDVFRVPIAILVWDYPLKIITPKDINQHLADVAQDVGVPLFAELGDFPRRHGKRAFVVGGDQFHLGIHGGLHLLHITLHN
jgi:hypothetical protein